MWRCFANFSTGTLKINNGGTENQQISKITNAEKHRNKRKWRSIDFFGEISGS